ncbi:hypothetical protein [Tortoise microvirus 55]|nr:hypothetical protein [Tortoise microvirus 44]QCS37111.1 hypothetical protein [Tortoise microvirus 55]
MKPDRFTLPCLIYGLIIALCLFWLAVGLPALSVWLDVYTRAIEYINSRSHISGCLPSDVTIISPLHCDIPVTPRSTSEIFSWSFYV